MNKMRSVNKKINSTEDVSVCVPPYLLLLIIQLGWWIAAIVIFFERLLPTL